MKRTPQVLRYPPTMDLEILADNRITATAKLVHMVLNARLGKKDRCWPSLRAIACEIGTGIRTVQRGIDVLIELGIWVKIPGSKGSNAYSPGVNHPRHHGQNDHSQNGHHGQNDHSQNGHYGQNDHSAIVKMANEVISIEVNQLKTPPPPTLSRSARAIETSDTQNKGAPQMDQQVFLNDLEGDKPHLTEKFETIYQAYPRKRGKADALKTIRRLILQKEVTFDELLAETKKYAAWVERVGKELQFVPYASTWYQSRGWEDEYDTEQIPQRGPKRYSESEINSTEARFNGARREIKVRDLTVRPEGHQRSAVVPGSNSVPDGR